MFDMRMQIRHLNFEITNIEDQLIFYIPCIIGSAKEQLHLTANVKGKLYRSCISLDTSSLIENVMMEIQFERDGKKFVNSMHASLSIQHIPCTLNWSIGPVSWLLFLY